jgi:hypothetical protein
MGQTVICVSLALVTQAHRRWRPLPTEAALAQHLPSLQLDLSQAGMSALPPAHASS